MRHAFVTVTLQLLALAALSGCSGDKGPSPDKDKKPEVYRIATRQLPPPPVYNRLRYVELPSLLPDRDDDEVASTSTSASAPLIAPVINFEAKNMKLDQVARLLGQTARYQSYCSSIIADRTVTLKQLGTIDELAEAISRRAGIKVVVDHAGQSVRFFPQHTETPEFYGSAQSSSVQCPKTSVQ